MKLCINRTSELFHFLFSTTLVVFILSGCVNKKPLGTETNPIKFYLLPSVDAKMLEDKSIVLENYLNKVTPYKFKVLAPQSYVAVVEAFGTKKADVAIINSFGYLKAFEKYNVEAKLIVMRNGNSTYQSQFVAKVGSKINKLEDLNDKKIAFVDASSTSGYLLPLKTLMNKNIKLKDTVFAMKHDTVISMVYQGQVDAGATFYSPPENGKIQDARRLVLTQYPDVESKIKIIDLSDGIPNDPVIFRKDMPEEMKAKIVDSLYDFINTPEGKDALMKLYGADNFKRATDADYNSVRQMLKDLGKTVEELLKK